MAVSISESIFNMLAEDVPPGYGGAPSASFGYTALTALTSIPSVVSGSGEVRATHSRRGLYLIILLGFYTL